MKRKGLLVILLFSVMLTLIAGCAGPTVKFGFIDLTSTPTGAKVYINGVDTGMVTPIIFTKEVGNYTVKLDKFHYKIWEGTVNVNADQTTYIIAPLNYSFTEIITLQPSSEGKDSDVDENSPNANSESYKALFSGCTIPYKKWRAYLQFDLSSVPGNARIIDAYPKLYQYSSSGTGNFTVGLYQITSDWGEDTITWNNQPDSSTVAEATSTVYASSTAWRMWYNIVDLVQGWVDGSITNQGMVLKSTDETSTTMIVEFWSSDYTTDTSKHPKLLIIYYIP